MAKQTGGIMASIRSSVSNAARFIARPWSQSSSLETVVRRFEEMVAREHGGSISIGDAYQRSAWVYGAVSIIAQTVARTPFKITSPDGKTEFTAGPIVEFVNEPNNYPAQNTSSKFREAYMTLLLIHGAVMRLFTEMHGDLPLKMTALPRNRFSPHYTFDDHGVQVVTRWNPTGNARRTSGYIPGDEIYHDALFNPHHDYEGLAPLTAALGSIQNDISVTQFGKRFFDNNASPGLVFTTDDPRFDNEAAKLATQLWNQARAGKGRDFDTVFLGNALTPHSIGIALDANVLVGLKSLTKEEIITGIYKVPLSIFGASATNGNQGVVIGGSGEASFSEKETFIVNVAIPWSRRYDEEFNIDVAWRFGSQYRGKHDWHGNEILEARRLERAKAAAELLKQGLAINAVIEWLKLEVEPQPWGDHWLVPNNMTTAEEIIKAGAKQLEAGKAAAGNQTVHTDPTTEAHRRQAIDDYAREAVARAIVGLQSGEFRTADATRDALDSLVRLRSRNGQGSTNGNGVHN